jgi:hypothetical protein
MHTYELVFTDGRDDAVRRLQFEAADASKALHVAHRQSGTRLMELWEDGAKLCELHRKPIGFDEVWVVSGKGTDRSGDSE